MLGTPEALVYFSARTPEAAGRYLGSASCISLIACLPFMAVAYFLLPELLKAQSPAVIRAARLFLLIGPIFALVGMLPHPFRGTGDFLSWYGMRLAGQSVLLASIVVAFFIGRVQAIFVAKIYLVIIASLFFPFVWIALKRLRGPFTPQIREFVPMLSYGLPCMLTGLPKTLNLRLDQMLMTMILAPRDLGFYVVAVAWGGAVAPMFDAIATVVVHSVASANDSEGSRNLITIVRITVIVAVLLVPTLMLATPFAIRLLFGPSFKESIVPALLLVPAAGVVGLNAVIQEGLRGLGRPYPVLWSETAGVVATIIGLAVFLKPYGILGAAAVSLASYLIVTLVLLGYVKRFTGVSPASLLFPRLQEFRLVSRRVGSFVQDFSGSLGGPPV
jgi:O-antigen/teichoic acid export membrane protein